MNYVLKRKVKNSPVGSTINWGFHLLLERMVCLIVFTIIYLVRTVHLTITPLFIFSSKAMTQPNKSKTRKNPSATPVKQPLKTAQTPVKPQTIYTLLVKAAIFLVVVVAVVKFTDFKGYFNPDYTNDHTRRKWNAFYQFTKDKTRGCRFW